MVHDLCRTPSNWRSSIDVSEYLEERGIIAIEGIDTRSLVRHLRDYGAQKGIISTEMLDRVELAALLDAAPGLVGENLVKTVSCHEAYRYYPGRVAEDHAFAQASAASAKRNVVVYDCGGEARHPRGARARRLRAYGCAVGTRPPATSSLSSPTACSSRTARATRML